MRNLTLIAVIATITGCATQTFTVHENGSSSDFPEQETMQPFFVSGIGQTQQIDAAEICGGADKVTKVEVQLRFLDGFLGVVTSGIYTPRTARVYCAD